MRVHTVLGAQDHGFYDAGQIDADEQLVLEFHHRARSQGPHVKDVLAHGLKERLSPGERVRLTARHDGQRTGFGAHGAAADGGIDEFDLFLGQRGADTLGRGRVYGAMVYKHLSRPGAVNRARVAKQDLFYVFRHGNAGEHEVRLLGPLTWALHECAAGRDKRLRFAAGPVVDINIVSRLAQIDCHVHAHCAETDEGNLHFSCTPSLRFCVRACEAGMLLASRIF